MALEVKKERKGKKHSGWTGLAFNTTKHLLSYFWNIFGLHWCIKGLPQANVYSRKGSFQASNILCLNRIPSFLFLHPSTFTMMTKKNEYYHTVFSLKSGDTAAYFRLFPRIYTYKYCLFIFTIICQSPLSLSVLTASITPLVPNLSHMWHLKT